MYCTRSREKGITLLLDIKTSAAFTQFVERKKKKKKEIEDFFTIK